MKKLICVLLIVVVMTSLLAGCIGAFKCDGCGEDKFGIMHKEEVMGDVLADELYLEGMEGYTAEWNINGEKASMGVKVVG